MTTFSLQTDALVGIVAQLVDGHGHIAGQGAVAAACAPDVGQMVDAHVFINEITWHF
jgi:hypothetical protein